ncbi:DNA-binding response regulator [Paenibacillus sp. CAA11]|uniref:response regulator transcription factor n=1 Tax=Paenibacillus sp. CAA11 TaxID=1532905 RepID=UPI000D388DFD|nr:response regulator [Paenibacillus sp. CAA11]AWB45516.1 DNA-binding response regulator [Paenibacillus sp. CAA11]
MFSILLVDDESYVTESLKQTIDWTSLEISSVYQASSALEAIDLLEAKDIHIVVTDIRMPEMTGLELIEVIAGRWPDMRSLLLTGYSDFQYAHKAIQLQAHDYILKPVEDEEFIKSVSGAVLSIKSEREEIEKYHQLLYSRRSDLEILHSNFMHDLLLGEQLNPSKIRENLVKYEINLEANASAVLVLVQMGKSFAAMDSHSVKLMEYAIGNMAAEIFHPTYRVWSAKAPHDCLVLILQRNSYEVDDSQMKSLYPTGGRETLEQHAAQFQSSVNSYLKGDISLIVSKSFDFPEGLASSYRAVLGYSYLPEQDHASSLQFLEDEPVVLPIAINPLAALHKPPSLMHLLETRQWEAAEDKLNAIFSEMKEYRVSRYHLYEAFLGITNAFIYIARKRGQSITYLDPMEFDPLNSQQMLLSISRLKSWTFAILEKLAYEPAAEENKTRSYIVKQVQQLIAADQGYDLSVKTIADKVYLHPVYLSKVYKSETGEGLGDYLIRKRMERALYLLKNTNKKIYEITSELGYQNPQYFSKMFRKHYGMTPNEFRDQ